MFLLIPLLVLVGCTATDPVMMKNPQTGQTAQCGPYNTTGLRHLAATQHEAQCIQDYKEQGFVRAP